MPRLSKLLEKLEDRIANKWGRWYERNKARVPLYAVLGALGWYFYGMLLNSLKLGRESVFNTTGEEVESIWVLNPFRNLFVVLTPFGLGVTAVILLLICLITKKGYSWFSGYHFTRDPRGFDILPDGTHGTSGFATKKELAEHLELGSAQEVTGMLLGRIKERPDDPDKYSTYVAHRMKPGENNNILCIGAPGSYKSRGFIIPFLMGCAQRSSSDGGRHPESVIATDPKGELFEMTAPYFEKNGFYVKAVNFLDMAHSDGWNCLAGLDTNPDLVTTVANTIIQNTSGPKEADDFWSRAELNLLMALIHYVCNKKDDRGNLLPLEQRSLGDVYKILAYRAEGSNAFVQAKRNRCYPPEVKEAATKEYLFGKDSILSICQKYCIRSTRSLQQWIKVYHAHGDFNSRKNSGGGSYMKQGRETTQEERVQIVKDCLASGKNYGEMALKYKVSYQQVRTWTLRFEEMSEAGLEDRRGKRKKDQVPRTELEKAQIEIEQLKHKLYLAEMERDLLKKLDEIERRDAFRK